MEYGARGLLETSENITGTSRILFHRGHKQASARWRSRKKIYFCSRNRGYAISTIILLMVLDKRDLTLLLHLRLALNLHYKVELFIIAGCAPQSDNSGTPSRGKATVELCGIGVGLNKKNKKMHTCKKFLSYYCRLYVTNCYCLGRKTR